MRICIWSFDEEKYDGIVAFLNLAQLSCFLNFWSALLHYRVWSLCNELFPQFSLDSFQTLYTCWKGIADVPVAI